MDNDVWNNEFSPKNPSLEDVLKNRKPFKLCFTDPDGKKRVLKIKDYEVVESEEGDWV